MQARSRAKHRLPLSRSADAISASRRTFDAADAHQARFRRKLIIQALPGTVAATLPALGLGAAKPIARFAVGVTLTWRI